MLAVNCPHVATALTLLVKPEETATFDLIKPRLEGRFEVIGKRESSAATKCDLCSENAPNVWACLSCNFQGCGRRFQKHASEHYANYREHCICVNVDTRTIWCYECDQELVVETGKGARKYTEVELLLLVVCQCLDPQSSEDSTESDEEEHSDSDNQAQPKSIYPWESVKNFLQSDQDWHDTFAPPHGLIGLRNTGNTCYLNSALQCLSNTQALRRVFLGPTQLVMPSSNNNILRSILAEYNQLTRLMWIEAERGAVGPNKLHHAVGMANPLFRGFAQHDSQEFLRTLLDSLHEGLKRMDHTRIIHPAPPADISSKNAKNQPNGHTPASASPFPAPTNSSQANGSKRVNGSSTTSSDKPVAAPKPIIPTESSISSLFEGKLLSTVTCGACHKTSETFDRFFDLSLSIPTGDTLSRIETRKTQLAALKQRESRYGENQMQTDDYYLQNGSTSSDSLSIIGPETMANNQPGFFRSFWTSVTSIMGTNSPPTQLSSCLHGFCLPDELTGADQYHCDHCKQLHDATKAFSIAVPPHNLCLHIKRFKFDYFGSKISDHVDFPLNNLDISEFCTLRSPDSTNGSEQPLQNGSHHTPTSNSRSNLNGTSPRAKRSKQNGTKSSTAASPAPLEAPPLYDLYGVICHTGGLHGGHYYAYAKNTTDGNWYEFNDSSVHRVDATVVASAEAYVLFYEQQTPEAKLEEREKIKSAIVGFLEQQQKLELESPQKALPPETAFVSLTWLTKWLNVNNPGPMNAPSLTCAHLKWLPHLSIAHFVPVPDDVAKYFQKTYGGLLLHRGVKCLPCEEEEQARRRKEMGEQKIREEIDKRRKFEYQQVMELGHLLDAESPKGYYFLPTEWVSRWLDFVNEKSEALPGPIDNRPLLTRHPKGTYRALNESVWRFLSDAYGGGPEIWGQKPQFPQQPVSKAEAVAAGHFQSPSDDE